MTKDKKNPGGRPRVSDADKIRRGYAVPSKLREKKKKIEEAQYSGPQHRDYVSIGYNYAKGVVGGEIVAGKLCKLACSRHLGDLDRTDLEYYFNPEYAKDVCAFVERLPHVEGSWNTPLLRLEPVQIFILSCIFGWRRKSDHGRRFSAVYIEAARKFAKSTLSAAVSLYCLTKENEIGPQIVIGATTGEQANKVFLPARRMAERSPLICAEEVIVPFSRSVTCERNGGFIQPINAKGKTQDGWNPHVAILDELHAHADRSLYDVIKSSFGARKNPLLWIITTAGYNQHGICYEQRETARKVLEGAVALEHLFAIIFTVDEGDDPFDEKVWVKANPMIGTTPTWESMRAYAQDARVSPGDEGEFKTKRLNVWMNAANHWLNVEQWKSCGDPKLKWEDFEGLDCWVGCDLADKNDIAAAVLCAFDVKNRLIFKPFFWLPEAVLREAKHAEGRSNYPYRTWAAQGHLHLTAGDWIDHNEIEAKLEEWIGRYAPRAITFDQFAAAQAMAARLNERHASPDRPLAHVLPKQARNVTDAAKELEARVKAGAARLRHDANPVMDWMAANVVVERRRDETLLPIKQSKMSDQKIDGIDALINAIAPAIRKQEPAPAYQVIIL